MPSWNNLPKEILHNIFSPEGLLRQTDVYNCIYVCKAWKAAAEPSAYKTFRFDNEDHIVRIISTFDNQEKPIRKYTKQLQFRDKKEIDYESYLAPLATIFPYVEEVCDVPNKQMLYRCLLHIRLDGKWNFIKKIPSADDRDDFPYYATTALACKNSLTSLQFNNLWVEDKPYSYLDEQYDRLASKLEQFVSLDDITLYKDSDERFQDFDLLLNKCPKLKTFNISIHNYSEDQAPPSTIDLNKIKIHPTIKEFSGSFIIDDDSTMNYIMHKFPNLREFSIRYVENNDKVVIRHLNITVGTLLKFIRYLENLPKFEYLELFLDSLLISQFFEFTDERIERLCICYSEVPMVNLSSSNNDNRNDLVTLSIEDDYDNAPNTTLTYCYSDQKMFHLRILRDHGEDFQYLTFKFPLYENPLEIDDKHTRDMVTGYFLDHIFKYCTNLENLKLSGCRIIRCDPSMSKSRSITTLSLPLDTTDEQVFIELSVRLIALKHLCLEMPFSGFIPKQWAVNVAYTNLETLTFDYDHIYRGNATKIAIKITTFDRVFFYEYDSTRNQLGIFESNIEGYENILHGQRNSLTKYHLGLSVCCQSIKELVFKFSDGDDLYDYHTYTINADD